MSHERWDNTAQHGLIKDGIRFTRKDAGYGDASLRDELKVHRSTQSGNLVIHAREADDLARNGHHDAHLVFDADDALAFADWLYSQFKGK